MDLRLCRGLSVTGQTFHLLQMLSEALGFMWPLQGNGLNGITCTHNGLEGDPMGHFVASQKKSKYKVTAVVSLTHVVWWWKVI